MQIPGKNAEGKRLTVNRDLSQDEKVWHFRSAWNVSALNCLGENYAPILEGYSSYILDYKRPLKRVNDRVEKEYRVRERSRRAALLAREKHMTRVYNFFALPTARANFCTAMLDIANRFIAAPPADAEQFALSNFDRVEQPFDQFFSDYETYQNMSAQWDAEYGAVYGPSQPGWVAVQRARANGEVIPGVEVGNPANTLASPTALAGTVTDDQTGAQLPVLPVQEGVVSQPVTEPLPSNEDTPL